MKRILPILFLSLLICAPFGAHAQNTPTATTPPAAPNLGQTALGTLNSALLLTPFAPFAGAASLVTGRNGTTGQCNFGADIACDLGEGLTSILQNIMFVFMQIVSFLLGVVGVLFNWLVVITVFQFGVFFGNSQGMLLAWGILRDVGNILILFGFIYAGVMMILDLHSFDARKAIPRLIIFAVLLNFSLFTAEAIVDVSNVLSAKLYQQAGQSVFQKCNGSTPLTDCTSQVGIAEVIIQDTGLGSSYSFGKMSSGDVNLTGTDHVHILLAFIGVIILMTIVLMLLLTASIMLLLRAVTLVVLLVTSPIGFAGLAIPQLESQAQKWWHTLLSNAFFAPIFLLLLFIGLKIMDGLRDSISGVNGGDTLISALANPNVSLGSILIVFALITGFFLAALMFAKNSGAAGAQFATNFVQKTLSGASSGATSFAYRHTIAKGGRAAGKRYDQFVGDMRHKGGLLGGTVGFFDDQLGGKHMSSGLKGLATVKVGGKSLDEVEKAKKHRDHETHAAHETAGRQGAVAAALKLPPGANRDAALKTAWGNLTASQRAESPYLQHMTKDLDDLVRIMSHSAYEADLKNDKVDPDVKEAMKKSRFDATNAPAVIPKMTASEVAGLSGSILSRPHVLAALKGDQLAAIKPESVTDTDFAAIKAYINGPGAGTAEVLRFRGLIGRPVARTQNNPGTPAVVRENKKWKDAWSSYYP